MGLRVNPIDNPYSDQSSDTITETTSLVTDTNGSIKHSVKEYDKHTNSEHKQDHSSNKQSCRNVDTALTVTSALLITFIVQGFWNSFSVLYPVFVKVYDSNRTLASLIQSSFMSILIGGTIVWSTPLGKYGEAKCMMVGASFSTLAVIIAAYALNVWATILLIGVIAGFGLSLPNTAPFLTLNAVLTTYKAPFIALCTMGSSLGQFVYIYITESLLEEYGLTGAMLILSGTLLNIIPLSIVILYTKPRLVNGTEVIDSKASLFTKTLFKCIQWRFYLAAANMLLLGIALFSEAKFLVDLMMTKGYTRSVGAQMVSFLGLANFCGRIIGTGFKFAFPKHSPLHSGVIMVLNASTHLMIVYWVTYTGYVVGSVLNGLTYGLMVTQLSAIYIDILPTELYPSGLVFGNIAGGIGSLFGGYFGGLIHDHTGSYDGLFLMAAALSICVAVIYFVIGISQSSLYNKQREYTSLDLQENGT